MSLPDYSLTGKVAIITGARRGMGRLMATTFAEAGADIAVCDKIVEDGELSSLANEIKKLGRRAVTGQVDVIQRSDVDKFVDKVVSEFGVIDILVNNAAVAREGLMIELAEEDWDLTFDTDVKGTWHFCAAVAKKMIEQKHGVILNMASIAGIWSLPSRNGAYNPAKASVISMTKVLARNLGRYNIRVVGLAPGMVEQPLSQPLWGDPHYRQLTEKMIPFNNRLGQASDVMGPALFLVSDAASYVTGHTLVVDGGMTI